jgi:Raf kinase inhibitor-like YbhB/YbcL family protein
MKARVRFLPLVLVVSVGFFVALASHTAAHQPVLASALAASQPELRDQFGDEHKFRVTSGTFDNGQTIPAVMIFNGQLGSVCTGSNASPQLSWTPAARGTHSYAVVMFDVTASFVHWGQYNVPASTTELAAGAGTAGSGPGLQVLDDAGLMGYVGPCPPPGLVPNGIHKYVITVYALDKELDLPQSVDFPPTGAALYRAMIGHVIEKTSITGLFSCTDASACS